jgi:biopolymer transport protein ExbB
MKHLIFSILLLLTLLPGLTAAEEKKDAAPGDWWEKSFTIRKKLSISTTAEGADLAQPLAGPVVLVRLHDGVFQFAAAQEDLSDLRFVAADGKTVLPHRIEKFDPLLNEAYVWVRLPEVPAGTRTDFWLYYGSPEPTAGAKEAGAELYDAETALVYHFSDGASAPADATKNGNNAKNAGGSSEGALIAGGLRLVGNTPVTIPESPTLAWAADGELTWSAWARPSLAQDRAVIFLRKDGGNSFLVGLDQGVPFLEINGQRTANGAPLVNGTWAHLAVTAAGGTITLYVNGAVYGTVSAALPAFGGVADIGGDSTGAGAVGFAGELDELQISRVSRGADWVKFTAIGQGTEASKLLTLGEDEAGGEGAKAHDDHSGYFAIILKNLTVDGWVVIYLCCGMAVLSWYVMVSKIFYLNSATKGNSLFLSAWREVATDLTALDHGDAANVASLGGRVKKKDQRALKRSSVFRIYHIGSEEIHQRLTRPRKPGAPLSTTSIEAIRASLDGGLVRESARLNAGIVLLTIAISGGPFLGLLGTVVGVMITFAAVAAAGDVNVNAIAPGIAAALLATVAGLAVAIPAMFGYNYLLTRIKGVNNDMHVFIDEFVTRMAEFYGDDHAESGQWPVAGGQSGTAIASPAVAKQSAPTLATAGL